MSNTATLASAPLLALAELVDSPSLAARWLPRFSDSERQRLERLARPQRRAQFVAAHALLRLAAEAVGLGGADRLDADRHDVDRLDRFRCEVDADGRPRIAAPGGWQVSLSHSGTRVVALLDRGRQAIGVDIERMNNERDIVSIVAAACSKHAGSRDQAYRIWAAHEARLKTAADGDVLRAWHALFDSDALAIAGTDFAPAAIHVFDLAAADAAASTVHRLDWSAA